MGITHIDHYNIKVPLTLLESLSRFYSEVLGLTEGYRPPFRSKGRWLYAQGRAVLHLTGYEDQAAATEIAKPTGWFSHIALKCEDVASTRARLDTHGIPYEIEQVPELGQTQIFFTDPAGIGVELNFEAAR